MRLLYVSGTYAPNAFSGSELSAHTLLKQLAQHHQVDVLVASDERYAPPPSRRLLYDGVEIHGIRHEQRADEIRSLVDSFAPDLIYTQPWWHDVALEVAGERGIPSIIRLPDSSFPRDLVLSPRTRPAAVVAQTREMLDTARGFGITGVLLPAFIDLDRVRTRGEDADRRFVTMINPVREKGGFLFRDIASRAPDREFAVVRGWWSLRDSEGRFDEVKIRRAYESQGRAYDGWIPEEPDFTGLGNVTVLPPRDAVHEIYDQTRILLCPSLWKEQFGRVIFEAAANGVLVLASGIPTLRENAGDAATFVDRFSRPRAWLKQIRRFDDPVAHEEARRRGQEYVLENYSLRAAGLSFLGLVNSLIGSR
ncbi:MAG: glycosyltransferase [Gemmatimonadales bacterium]|nr:MAG: glycosyltransferase [Gemmatimonadales bacterium]